MGTPRPPPPYGHTTTAMHEIEYMISPIEYTPPTPPSSCPLYSCSSATLERAENAPSVVYFSTAYYTVAQEQKWWHTVVVLSHGGKGGGAQEYAEL